MTTTLENFSLTSAIEQMLAAANGKRRTRTLELAEVISLLRSHLATGKEKKIAHTVANSYGYASSGTYCTISRKTSGEIVIGIWADSTNRAGRLPGVSPYLRKADKIQAAVDSLKTDKWVVVCDLAEASAWVDCAAEQQS